MIAPVRVWLPCPPWGNELQRAVIPHRVRPAQPHLVASAAADQPQDRVAVKVVAGAHRRDAGRCLLADISPPPPVGGKRAAEAADEFSLGTDRWRVVAVREFPAVAQEAHERLGEVLAWMSRGVARHEQGAGNSVCCLERRTRVAGLFPNEASVLRLVTAILMETSEGWKSGRAYLTLKPPS